MRFLAGASACLIAGAAHAEATPTMPLGAMLQSFFALLLVLAVIVAAAWLLKRAQRLPGASSVVLRSISGIAVGPKERVVVVEIGETWLVLGVAPGQVRTLHTLPRQALPAGGAEAPRFAEWLARARGRSGSDHA
jgi:flagellar protein FliO/FliZ